MNAQKLLIATVASFVVMFGLGGLFHMVLLTDWMTENGTHLAGLDRNPPDLIWIAAGVLILAFLMSYLYPKGVEGDNKMMQGLKFGVIMGILWALPFALILYGSTNIFTLPVIAMDTAVNIVQQGIGGIVIAYIYGMPAKRIA